MEIAQRLGFECGSSDLGCRRQLIVDSSDLPEALRVQLQALESARRRKRAGGDDLVITEEEQADDDMEGDEVLTVSNGNGTANGSIVSAEQLTSSSIRISINGTNHSTHSHTELSTHLNPPRSALIAPPRIQDRRCHSLHWLADVMTGDDRHPLYSPRSGDRIETPGFIFAAVGHSESPVAGRVSKRSKSDSGGAPVDPDSASPGAMPKRQAQADLVYLVYSYWMI